MERSIAPQTSRLCRFVAKRLRPSAQNPVRSVFHPGPFFTAALLVRKSGLMCSLPFFRALCRPSIP